MKRTSEPGVDWKLLKNVSRSFYLTLRLLPGEVRETIALAYLVARLSDTDADGAQTPGERQLVARRDEVMAALTQSSDRAAIEKVWTTIQSGQRFDRDRFPGPPLTPEELDRYTYLVAGCVGEFWTEICAAKMPGFARRSDVEMRELGIDFGKGLQLVNILRDRHSDSLAERIYLPTEAVPAALQRAEAYLDSGEIYARALRSRRLRAACLLPIFLARETLALIRVAPDSVHHRVKRNRVHWLLVKALLS